MRVLFVIAIVLWAGAAVAQDTRISHGLSLFGEIKYPKDFSHFEYADPKARKGGEVHMEAIGTYDTLNGFTIKGTPAAGIGLIYDTLTEQAFDEPSSSYGLIAKSIETPADLSWVAFELRPEARWHDGMPLTADDVVFSFNLLKEKGAPFFRHYYANITGAVAEGPHRVKFTFSGPKNRELPTIIGELTVLPKHYWQDRDFSATTLDPPLGSGPYRITKIDPGRSITYQRVPDYWAADLPVMRGRHNFDTLAFEYYRDRLISLEAFKAGNIDFRDENNAKVWATQYDFPAIRDGQVVKAQLPDDTPTGMQGFVFNLRRDKFKDRRVRAALGYTFDFEWSNRNLFYGQYTRTESYFANSELAATGLPSPAELKLLEPLRAQLPEEVFTTEYHAPKTDGSGNPRRNLREAADLLEAAGWTVKGGKRVNAKTGEPMQIEILIVQEDVTRIVAPMVRNMERLGVKATIRVVDTSQYVNRLRDYDYDIILMSWGETLSPGNEQRGFWGSAAADRPGSRNYIGIKDPAIDALIDHVIFADDRAGLVTATRALDRALLWNHFVIPNFHIASYRIAYWNRFAYPAVKPKYTLGFPDTWWIDPAKDKALKRGAGAK